MDVTVSDPMVGRLLDGRYHVGRRVARGGMATVYEALDTRLHRTVAVKVLHAGLLDNADFVRRFQREARSAARLSHPNVVAMFDQGEDDGTPYLTMEYVAGQTLRQRMIDTGRFSPDQALQILDQVLQALSVAHAAGLVHRDVKPENVLLGQDGAVKVADFGLARAVSAATSTATQGLLIGTVSYLAPEQVTHGAADARADVYATGIVLYEMLVGAKPHDGDSPITVAYKHVNEDVPPPSAKVPGIPDFIDGLVLRATARDANVRPADGRVLLHHLRRARSAVAQGVDDPQLTQDLTMFRRSGPGLTEHTLIAPREQLGTRDHGVLPPERRAHLDDDAPRHVERPELPWWRQPGVIAGAVLVLLLATGAALWLAATGPFTRVPAVNGVPEGQLVGLGADSGLEFVVTRKVFDERVPKGRVLQSDPAPHERTFRGSSVEIWLSRGPERHAVPRVAGMTLARAQNLLAASKLTVGTINRVYSDTVGTGRVISATPKPGTPLKRGAVVGLEVSSGPAPVAIPSVVGVEITQAKATLEQLGLVVKAAEGFSDTVPPNAVISQDPGPGAGHRRDVVTLVMSKGPEFVPVPDVRGQQVEAAKKLITDAGFQVEVRKNALFVGSNVVVVQTPPGGEKARVGSVVVIEIV